MEYSFVSFVSFCEEVSRLSPSSILVLETSLAIEGVIEASRQFFLTWFGIGYRYPFTTNRMVPVTSAGIRLASVA